MSNAHPVSIRQATAADADALEVLATQTFTDTFGHLYTPENLAAHIIKTCSADFFSGALQQGDSIFLACDGQALIGYAKAGKMGLPVECPPQHAQELHRLYVKKEYVGRGIGHLLVQSVLTLPAMQASPAIYVGVYEHNHGAQRFYGRYGFTPVGEYIYYVGPHADRELILLRPHPAS